MLLEITRGSRRTSAEFAAGAAAARLAAAGGQDVRRRSTRDACPSRWKLVCGSSRLATSSTGQQTYCVFGLPGLGKTHAACALGHALVTAGHSVLFTPTFKLVQELLAAKRTWTLPRALRKLDVFDLIILDDIGYVQQTPRRPRCSSRSWPSATSAGR